MNREEAFRELIAECRGVHSALDRFDHEVANSLGVTRNDLRCLNLLEHGPVSTGEIASNLGLTTGAVTALVDRLEKAEYVSRQANPDDRRGVLVSATPRIFKTLAKCYRSLADSILESFSTDSMADMEISIAALSKLRMACQSQLESHD